MKLQEFLNVHRASSKLRVELLCTPTSWEQDNIFDGYERDYDDFLTEEFKTLCEEWGDCDIVNVGAGTDINDIAYTSVIIQGWED
ncbi:hypothetical protein [Parvibacter caecicola]|uniref:hypothetical protein n=1 Tax=Parvibacter caecicola TaxID=747645 RepID=UPI00249C139A|nr:hypothetical protein [Parvibacter caecicola]